MCLRLIMGCEVIFTAIITALVYVFESLIFCNVEIASTLFSIALCHLGFIEAFNI